MKRIREIEISDTPPSGDKLWLKPTEKGTDVMTMLNGKWNPVVEAGGCALSQNYAHYQDEDVKSVEATSDNTIGILSAISAYQGCPNLTSVRVAKSSYTSLIVANSMFHGCSSLETVEISSGALHPLRVALRMFADCAKLKTFRYILDYDNDDIYGTEQKHALEIVDAFNMFYKCSSLETVDARLLPNLTSAFQMFYLCKNLKDAKIEFLPNLVMGRSMFYGCNNLTEFKVTELPNLVSGPSMFYGCNNLTNVAIESLPNLVSGRSMFCYCNNLTEFKVTELPKLETAEWMFDNTLNIKQFNLSLPSVKSLHGVFYIEPDSLGKSKTEAIVLSNLPDNLTDLSWMVYGQTNLSTFSHPKGSFKNVKAAVSAFNHCRMLKSLDLGDGDFAELVVGSWAFKELYLIEELSFSEGTRKLETAEEMFSQDQALKSIKGLNLSNLVLSASSISPYLESWWNEHESSGNYSYFDCAKNMFKQCDALVDCVLEGTLYKSDVDLRPCVSLNEESLKSWVNALYDWDANLENKETDDTDHVLFLTESQQAIVGDDMIIEAIEKGWTISE